MIPGIEEKFKIINWLRNQRTISNDRDHSVDDHTHYRLVHPELIEVVE